MTAEMEVKWEKWKLNKKKKTQGKRARRAVQAKGRISGRGSYHTMELGNRKSYYSVGREELLKGSLASHHY